MRDRAIHLTTVLLACSGLCHAGAPTPDGHSVIRRAAGVSEIVITTTPRLAGAIHSVSWGGQEFIDSTDHGRQLQSACSFDCAAPGEFWAEAYNPTEAGSRADGAGPGSTSRLLSIHASEGMLRTSTRMAFWLAPGEDSAGRPARNPTKLSRHRLSKEVRIGYKGWPHAIEYTVTFHVAGGERHTLAQFEALTGYMPSAFSSFWKLDLSRGELQSLDDGPGEQQRPVVLATPSGSHAMGIYAPPRAGPGEGPGYGRWRFGPEKVNKWNCVFRVRDPRRIAPGDYRYRVFVAIGKLDDVKATLLGIHRDQPGPT